MKKQALSIAFRPSYTIWRILEDKKIRWEIYLIIP